MFQPHQARTKQFECHFSLNTVQETLFVHIHIHIRPGVQVSTEHGAWVLYVTLNLWPVFPDAGIFDQLVEVSWTTPTRINLSLESGGRAFAYAGPTTCSSLSDSLKDTDISLLTFTRPSSTLPTSTLQRV